MAAQAENPFERLAGQQGDGSVSGGTLCLPPPQHASTRPHASTIKIIQSVFIMVSAPWHFSRALPLLSALDRCAPRTK
jgi:hypothetical protein